MCVCVCVFPTSTYHISVFARIFFLSFFQTKKKKKNKKQQIKIALCDAGIIYHGAQSSTSSDLSPMSEQKSLPRRGRSRYHHQQYQFSTNTTPRHHNSNKSNNNHTTNTATNTNTATSATSCPSNTNNKILSPRNNSGNLKSISSTFKSQDSIQCHIPTLVKSPSISTQQQKQFHKQQLQQQQQQQNNKCSQNQNQNQNPNPTPCSSSLKQQQPLLIQPKLHQLDPQSTHATNGPDGLGLVGLDGGVSTLASVVPVTCMPPSSQFRPIPHKSIMPNAHEPHMSHMSSHPSQHHHSVGGGAGGGGVQAGTALLNPSTALLSSKFFTAPTLPLPK